MRVKVDVTKADIKYGKRAVCEECPVARAVSRALKSFDVEHISVNDDNIIGVCYSKHGRVRPYRIATPAAARRFINRWDYSEVEFGIRTDKLQYKHPKTSFAPFSFYLTV